jgi:hypothetical protein
MREVRPDVVAYRDFDHGMNQMYDKLTANERRALAEKFVGSWLKDHELKLGRDYYVDTFVEGIPRTYMTKRIVRISIKNPKVAVLFKLTWGGNS